MSPKRTNSTNKSKLLLPSSVASQTSNSTLTSSASNIQTSTISSDDDFKEKIITNSNLEWLNEYKNRLSSKPVTTIRQIKERYKLLVEIMKPMQLDDSKKLVGFDWDNDVIQLPNLCLTPFDNERFKFDKETKLITIINRKEAENESYVYDTYLNQLNTTQQIIYLYGLKGIGKSFIIYLMVAKLLGMQQTYRVIYLNLAGENVIINSLKILKAIIMYDFVDSNPNNEDFKNFVSIAANKDVYDFINSIVTPSDLDSAKKIIFKISEFYLNTNQISLVFVLDQINMILDNPLLVEQMNFLAFLLEKDSTYKKIMSASASNQINYTYNDYLEKPDLVQDNQVQCILSALKQNNLDEIKSMMSIHYSDETVQAIITTLKINKNNNPRKENINKTISENVKFQTKNLNLASQVLYSLPNKFNDDEFLTYLSLNSKYFMRVETRKNFDQIKSITGGVPLEISYFFKSIDDIDSFNGMMNKYINEFADSSKHIF